MAAPVVAESDTDHPRISPIGIILTPQLMISIRYDTLLMFDSVGRITGHERRPPSAAAFAAVMQAFVARQADLLEEARARLDEVSHRVFRTPGAAPAGRCGTPCAIRDKLQLLGRIGERISIIRESLLGVDRMVDFAADNAKHWFAGDLAERLQPGV